MSPPTTIDAGAQFHQDEPSILAAINGTPRGAELFLADPFRFLSEHGFPVSAELQARLESRAPALTKAPKQRYDASRHGRAALSGNPANGVSWHIRTLGVTL